MKPLLFFLLFTSTVWGQEPIPTISPGYHGEVSIGKLMPIAFATPQLGNYLQDEPTFLGDTPLLCRKERYACGTETRTHCVGIMCFPSTSTKYCNKRVCELVRSK